MSPEHRSQRGSSRPRGQRKATKEPLPMPKPEPSPIHSMPSLPPPLDRPRQFAPQPTRPLLSSPKPNLLQRSAGSQHPEQRLGVFVDVQNMYHSGKQLYNAKVNFAAILKEAVQGRKLVRAIAYVIKADNPEEQTFFDVLGGIGYEVKLKGLQIFPGGAKKADWDIGIAMDAIELAPKLDTVVLVSGDGDFVPLLQHLRRALGCRVEVIAFGKSSSGKLREEADVFTDLEDDVKRFLISR